MSLIPDVPPKSFTLSAVIVGYILLDDATANEQNAMGNWLMLVAQVLCTNAVYKQVQGERKREIKHDTTEETVAMLEKMIKSLTIEVNNLKNNL